VSFAAITLYVASQRVFIVISLPTQSGNFWAHPRTSNNLDLTSQPGPTAKPSGRIRWIPISIATLLKCLLENTTTAHGVWP